MVNRETHFRCEQFLVREAEILDNKDYETWLDLLTDDVEYVAPQRIVREKGSEKNEFSEDTFYFYDDKISLNKRVEKLNVEETWGENPPSRTRRFVSNVRVQETDDEKLLVKNNLLLYHNKGMPQQENIVSAERYDTLIEDDGELKIDDREIFIDASDLNIEGLTVFL